LGGSSPEPLPLLAVVGDELVGELTPQREGFGRSPVVVQRTIGRATEGTCGVGLTSGPTSREWSLSGWYRLLSEQLRPAGSPF
ncbi:MAG: hypothetical protein ACR2PK_02555, partial [Acidimicrobiales bacterium]